MPKSEAELIEDLGGAEEIREYYDFKPKTFDDRALDSLDRFTKPREKPPVTPEIKEKPQKQTFLSTPPAKDDEGAKKLFDKKQRAYPTLDSAIGEFTLFKEGFREGSYDDTEGKRTVGYGFNLDRAGARDVIGGYPELDYDKLYSGEQKISKDAAKQLAEADFKGAWESARRVIPHFDRLPAEAQDAFLDMTYNMGEGKVQFPKMLKAIRNRDLERITAEIKDSRYYRRHVDEWKNDRPIKNIERIKRSFRDWPEYKSENIPYEDKKDK